MGDKTSRNLDFTTHRKTGRTSLPIRIEVIEPLKHINSKITKEKLQRNGKSRIGIRL